MTVEVRFDKRRYHLHGDMMNWCNENIGKGGWSYDTPKTWEGMDGEIWVVRCAFGNTVFAFKNEADASMFILRWE